MMSERNKKVLIFNVDVFEPKSYGDNMFMITLIDTQQQEKTKPEENVLFVKNFDIEQIPSNFLNDENVFIIVASRKYKYLPQDLCDFIFDGNKRAALITTIDSLFRFTSYYSYNSIFILDINYMEAANIIMTGKTQGYSYKTVYECAFASDLISLVVKSLQD